jgi:hypothetical protein
MLGAMLVEGELVQNKEAAQTEVFPQEELASLEATALARGMSVDEQQDIVRIGNCDLQIQEQIKRFKEWLVQNPE